MSFQDYVDSLSPSHQKRGVKTPVLIGLVSLVVVVVLVGAYFLVSALSSSGSFEIETADATTSSALDGNTASSDGSAEDAPSVESVIVVHVGGAVCNPGLYELAQGARVGAAIEAAGGMLEGAATEALNLARVLSDGEQIIVPTQEEVSTTANVSDSGSQVGDSTSSVAGKININTADESALDTLPGIGPSTASKIVADREANGPFESIEDIKRVSGIGDKKYEQLASLITVG